jgi:carbon storage regulator CsrA
MLVLTRKQTQTLCIGDTITVTVLRIEGNKVRVGVSAPDGCRILRSELLGQSTAATENKSPLHAAARC